jgi:hypothetical protein
MLLIIEVIYSLLDYNILLVHSFMYSMNEVSSSGFCMMIFPHNGKIVTIDQLTYHNPRSQINLYNVFPSLDGN